MFGMGGMNPKKMQAVMKQMGITQEEIDSSKVIIEKTDGSNITINNPSVTKMNIQGQDMFQIQGDVGTEEEGFTKEDIDTVVEKTGKSEEEAMNALQETGDLAEAILKLSE